MWSYFGTKVRTKTKIARLKQYWILEFDEEKKRKRISEMTSGLFFQSPPDYTQVNSLSVYYMHKYLQTNGTK